MIVFKAQLRHLLENVDGPVLLRVVSDESLHLTIFLTMGVNLLTPYVERPLSDSQLSLI